MVRSTMFVAVWMVLGALAPAWAQECTNTYDAVGIGVSGFVPLSFVFEESATSTTLQTGGLAITSEGGTITLPELGGSWLATNRCQLSVWTVNTSGAGRASGSGVTVGEQLIGVITLTGAGTANGTYVIVGEAATEVEEPPIEEPSPELAAQTPTPASAPAQ